MRLDTARSIVTALILCAGVSPSILAQGRMLALPAASVPHGQSIRVMSPPCAKPTTVFVDGKLFPVTANDSGFDLTTASLSPGAHQITTDCDGVKSDPASLTVVEAKAVDTPTVVCAVNTSPRDGVAMPLTSAAQAEETSIVNDAKAKSSPAPEETTRLLTRCDKDWVWTFRLEDSLSLNVLGLKDWEQVDANRRTPLHLFIAGIELPNVAFTHGLADPVSKTDNRLTILTFAIETGTPEERAASRKAWAQVLRTARSNAWNYGANEMSVSLGPAGGTPWPTTAKLRINPYPTGLAASAVLAAVALAILLVVLAWRTPLLRDDGGKTAPFSLAKHQMAVWFFVIFSAFLFVTVTTGQAAAMSTTALALIGISGLTGLAAVAIDRRKQAVDSGDAKAPPEPPERISQGWATDILSDEYGLSFHRLQMAAWTLGMAIVFIVAVWRTFGMPDFDATMLGLLGISSGTYLGFKFPEKQATADTAKKE
jgi:hypothetical protein